ncbi:MAG: ferredoxin [Synergistaceae bacterium]|nr:ferredoxin [Synergistaceae bacterium]
MRISLNRDECIGCGLCSQVCPDVFGADTAAGVAKLLREESDDPRVKDAKDSCPVGCIRVEQGV